MKLEAFTPDGRFAIVTLETLPELSHTFNSGLNSAPRYTVKIGELAVSVNLIPFKVASGF